MASSLPSRYDCRDFFITCKNSRGKNITPMDSGIYFGIREIRVHYKKAKNLAFWIHEFTEVSMLELIERVNSQDNLGEKTKWGMIGIEMNPVQFRGYKKSRIAHFISPYGIGEEYCLDTLTKENKPTWK